MTGCLIFDNKSFSSIGGGPIIDGITSTVLWNAGNPEGTQAIVFQSNRTAVSSICYPSLVTTPMAAPVTNSPLASPIADSPITPPSTDGNTSIVYVLIGTIVSIADAIIALVFCIG